jgi:hypothetical protein
MTATTAGGIRKTVPHSRFTRFYMSGDRRNQTSWMTYYSGFDPRPHQARDRPRAPAASPHVHAACTTRH